MCVHCVIQEHIYIIFPMCRERKGIFYQALRVFSLSSLWACCSIWILRWTFFLAFMIPVAGAPKRQRASVFWLLFFFSPVDQNEIQLFSASSLLWHITKLLRKAFMFLLSLFLSNMFSDLFLVPSHSHSHMYRHITHLETVGLCPAARLVQ